MNSGAKKKDVYSVALVTSTGGVDDKSFNQSAWTGIKRYGEKNGLKQGANGYTYFVSNDNSEIKSNLQQAVKANYKLVVGISFMGGPAMNQVAKANPKTNFAMVEAKVPTKNAVQSCSIQNNHLILLVSPQRPCQRQGRLVSLVA